MPIPDVLIRLGFIDWWRGQLALPGLLLFPEFPAGHDGKVSDIFGMRRGRIFARLGIKDAREDFYAGRMTVSTQLMAVRAPDHVRKSIIGHEHDGIINRHYTEANLALMKSYLERINLGHVIAYDSRYGFPIIRGCTLLKERPLSVTLTLDRSSQPQRIEIRDPSSSATQVIAGEGELDPTDDAAVYSNLQNLGSRLARALRGRRFRFEGMLDALVERKMGLLLAVGMESSGGASAGEDRRSDSECSAELSRHGDSGFLSHVDVRSSNERTEASNPRCGGRTVNPEHERTHAAPTMTLIGREQIIL